MNRLITAAAATYALVLMFGGCSSKTAVPICNTQALNSAASLSSSKLSPQTQAKFDFPKASCGDKSTAANDTWYPVFVDGGDLNTIRHQFCADAVATVRKDTKTPSVQLASFTNRDRASEFANTVEGTGTASGNGGGVARLGWSEGCRAIANTIATAPTMNRANTPFLNVLNSIRSLCVIVSGTQWSVSEARR